LPLPLPFYLSGENLLLVLPRQRRRKLFHVEQSPANGGPLASDVRNGLVSTACTCVIYRPDVPSYSERRSNGMSGVEQPHQRVGSCSFCPCLSVCHSLGNLLLVPYKSAKGAPPSQPRPSAWVRTRGRHRRAECPTYPMSSDDPVHAAGLGRMPVSLVILANNADDTL
jgi:hypothetical protein